MKKHKHDWRYVSAVYENGKLTKGKKRCIVPGCGAEKGGGREDGTAMRIPLDYDSLPVPTVMRDLRELWDIYHYPSLELTMTSVGHRTAILIMDTDLDTAINIIQQSRCDPEYKKWVSIHRDLTERVTRKNMTGDFPEKVT